MNSEKLKHFFIPLVIVIASVALAVYFAMQLVENVETMITKRQTIESKEKELAEKRTKLEDLKKQEEEENRKMQERASKSKPFYKPTASGMNTEAVIAGEFTEILELIRANKIKVRSIKYDYNPADDEFIKKAGAKYQAARLNMEMVATYTDYNNFLKELYKHEHFLDIQSVEIVPYRKNKQILLINFKLKLYSQKTD